MNAWRLTGWVCATVVVLSVAASVLMAIGRSWSLVSVTVTALDPSKEPSDHDIPLFRRREALPDYELSLIDDRGHVRYLGVKPDESAAAGLTWRLDAPVSVSQIAAVRLREKEMLVSDSIAEVQIVEPPVESNGYRFSFVTERSFGAGLQAFFATPIGIAIAVGFSIAVILIVIASYIGI